jgi:hypothetical protein
MIKANELRLGNLVYPDMSYPEPIKVCAKDFEDTLHLNPIPLTEEWLLKFGFVLCETEPWNVWSDELLYLTDVLKKGDGFNWMVKHNEAIPINSVHQLQNLYFALTGKELKIEL